jgi:hypothetical protein
MHMAACIAACVAALLLAKRYSKDNTLREWNVAELVKDRLNYSTKVLRRLLKQRKQQREQPGQPQQQKDNTHSS